MSSTVFPCPLCGGKSHSRGVHDANTAKAARVWVVRRIRTCVKCKHCFSTFETSDANLLVLLEMKVHQRVLHAKLVEMLEEMDIMSMRFAMEGIKE